MTIKDFFLKADIKGLAGEYGLPEDKLRELMTDLPLIIEYSLSGPPLTVVEASSLYDIPQKALRAAQRAGQIGNPITADDKAFLSRLAKGWGKTWFLRPQVARLGRTERQQLIQAPQFTAAWERYIYGVYLNRTSGQRHIKIDNLIIDVQERFPKLTMPRHKLYKGIRAIRDQVKEDKAYAKSKNIPLDHYAKKRGIDK